MVISSEELLTQQQRSNTNIRALSFSSLLRIFVQTAQCSVSSVKSMTCCHLVDIALVKVELAETDFLMC